MLIPVVKAASQQYHGALVDRIIKLMLYSQLHSRSGETVGNWVGNQLPVGWDTRLEWGYFQLPTQKAAKPVGYQLYKRWAGDWARFRQPIESYGRLYTTVILNLTLNSDIRFSNRVTHSFFLDAISFGP